MALSEDPAAGSEGRVVLAVSHEGLKRAELCSLVLLAVNISHKVVRSPDGWRLEVSPADLELARHHLIAFEEENRLWPPPQRQLTPESRHQGLELGLLTPLVGLMVFYGVTGPWGADNSWFQRGAADSRLLLAQQESWRIVTGLTLHADVSHLFGNIALGGLLLSYLASQTGIGAAWLLALTTGAVGNYLNALYQGGNHRSVGFSTALFGVIGCLCGLRMIGARAPRSILLPLGAGAGLLAMLGTEGERTDVGAHLWGLGVGVVCGILWRWPLSWSFLQAGWSQTALGAGSFLIVLAAWWLALAG